MAKIKTNKLYLICCEGLAEQLLVSYIKIAKNSKSRISYHPLNGFDCLDAFNKRYTVLENKIKGNKDYSKFQELKPEEFVFVFDNDLQESHLICKEILKKGHKVIQLDPNIEGLVLQLVGSKISPNEKNSVYRDKLKKQFNQHFKKDAHELKDKDKSWEIIFGKNGCNIPQLRTQFKSLDEILNLLDG
jgi:hypothetical protein